MKKRNVGLVDVSSGLGIGSGGKEVWHELEWVARGEETKRHVKKRRMWYMSSRKGNIKKERMTEGRKARWEVRLVTMLLWARGGVPVK